MKRIVAVAVALAAVAALAVPASFAEEVAPVGSVLAVKGTVQVGKDGAWQAAEPKQSLFDGQVLRTGEASSLEVMFSGDVPAALGEKTEIAVADLLLKARLEKTKAKITTPADGSKAEMQVTPMTGVRGTEKSEEKAGDLKREHYWNEGAPAAK